MEHKMSQTSTVRNLRILYPIWVLVGIFSIIYVPSILIDFTDPLQTTENITENILLFRLGIAGRLVSQLLFIIIPFLLYKLFRNFDKTTSALMLILALISIPISMLNEVISLNVINHLDNPVQVVELLQLYNQGMNISIIFWGLWLLPLGWLVYKFNLFPKLIGFFLFLAGFGYLINSFFKIISPDFDQLSLILEIMTFGELLFILWLVFRGINKRAHNNVLL
ncbi:DUF4386 domain-containing protein [Aquimarina algicola]|uniref:DUF4386 domain-containing protein n=1 Tax=Aquimarina algicola TaxID=2589995 RepID=A0A504J4T2_9FLAO|nr:DUF4386 domain-containing protein [Aquimarina algicola]TPN82908.1 DUF4386 domain-containing protein [Aquimarina algicola]